MSPRDIRLNASLSIQRAAAFAGVSGPTVKLYEASRDAVSAPKRRALDAYYQTLTSDLKRAQKPLLIRPKASGDRPTFDGRPASASPRSARAEERSCRKTR